MRREESTGIVLTLGSPRQSGQFARFIRDRFRLVHVLEETNDQTRSMEAIVDDAAVAVDAPEPLLGVVAFGRATVIGGIETMANAVAHLVAARPDRFREIPIIVPTPEAASALCDKWKTVVSLEAIGLPVPRTTLDHDPEGPAPPVVLKARNLTGGVGIVVAATHLEAETQRQRLRAAGLSPLVMSEYVKGIEASVKVLRLGSTSTVLPMTVKGLTTIPVQHGDDKIKFSGHVWPSGRVVESVVRLADAYEIQGLLSVEGILTADDASDWKITEVAPRVTGSLPMAASCVIAFNFYEHLVRHVNGQTGAPLMGRGIAVDIPMYGERAEVDAIVECLNRIPWVQRMAVDDLAQLPHSDRDGYRARVGITAPSIQSLLRRTDVLDYLLPGHGVSISVQESLAEMRRRLPMAITTHGEQVSLVVRNTPYHGYRTGYQKAPRGS